MNRNLGIIDDYALKHPGCLQKIPLRQQTMLQVIRTLHSQYENMYQSRTHKAADRIVTLSQNWVRPIVRGKQTADVEFGAKVEMSVVDGFLRIKDFKMRCLQRKHYLPAVGGNLPESLRTLSGQSPHRQDLSYQRKPEVLQGTRNPPQRPETGKAIHGSGRS